MKNHYLQTAWFILLIVIVISGCSILPSSNTVETAHPGWTYFADDFSATPNGWGTLGRDGGEVIFEYGGLVIKMNTPNSLYWTVNEGSYADIKIDVDAVLLDGPSNDNFGVVCRFSDNNNFYGFLITHDGYYGIFKMLDGQMVLTRNKTNLDYSEAIRQGGVVNHVTAECNGNVLKLSVNETLLSEIQDSSFSTGQIGLIAGAYENAGVQVLFDNLKVTQP